MKIQRGSEDLVQMYWDACDDDRDAYIEWSVYDDSVVLYVTVDGEEFHNDFYEEELSNSDYREAKAYYYG